MNTNPNLIFHKKVWLIPSIFIFIIWFIYFIEICFNYNFNKYGVLPRDIKGLRGVLFSPFVHTDTNHLFNNSIPLFVLLSSLFYFYKKVAFKVLIYGAFLLGFLLWLIGRDSFHIGASGIVYLLFSFLFFSGIFKNHYRLIALSLIVIFLYGSMIWYILPIKEGMSWEGHLSGFSVGLMYAYLYRKQGTVKEEHKFTETEFDTFFDENGNLKQEIKDVTVSDE